MPLNTTSQGPDAMHGRLLRHLPALYQEDPFAGRFLSHFEDILLGTAEGEHPGLERTIAQLWQVADPDHAHDDFLPWLGDWVGATLLAELPVEAQRTFLSHIAQYYRRRGTKGNLIRLLRLFTGGTVSVEEVEVPQFQIGVHSSIGIDTYIEGGPSNVFRVVLNLPRLEGESDDSRQSRLGRLKDLAIKVIDLEKPAHTACELQIPELGSALRWWI